MINGFFYTPAKLFGAALLAICILTVAATSIAKNQAHWNIAFSEGNIIRAGKTEIGIKAIDLIPEPGEFSSNAELEEFYSRQSAISKILSSEESITVKTPERELNVLKKEFSIFNLSILFWIQLIVGFGAAIISTWIWALRPKRADSSLFFVSGLSTLCFTYSAAIYTTREIALPVELFKLLVSLNVIGASLFGISVLALFLIYPFRFKYASKLIIVETSFFAAWTLLSIAGMLPASAGVNLITLTEMIFIIIAIGAQFYCTQHMAKEKASLTWLGLSILVGAGSFIVLNALPLVIGVEIPMIQAYAFLFFLFIYLGLAAGISKYRLFDVGSWAYRLLFYAFGIVLLIILDFSLVFFTKLERIQALSLSFFGLTLFYLPFRDLIYDFFRKDKAKIKSHELINEALSIVLANGIKERRMRWESLLQQILQPLEMNIISVSPSSVIIQDHGTTLSLPAIGDIPAYQIKYRNQGKSLFDKNAQSTVEHLSKLIKYGDSSRDTYERGVKEERQRMAQDLHDDVGARLLTGLHDQKSDLRETIQAALVEIRSIVSGIAGKPLSFSDFHAELRFESIKRGEALGLQINWPHWNKSEDFVVDYQIHKTIRSITREIVSNIIKHAKASILDVELEFSRQSLKFTFIDNGIGLPLQESAGYDGMGLKFMKKRVSEINGDFDIQSIKSGTEIKIRIPI